jgi:hypothetical protein
MSSPNARFIQTAVGRNNLGKSECEAYSDSKSKNLPWQVRMRGLFRQQKQEPASASPNARPIQTAEARTCLGKSECEAYSDSKSKNLPWQVRMRGLFRQQKQEHAFGKSECEVYSDSGRKKQPWQVRMRIDR